jgi:cyanophycinase
MPKNKLLFLMGGMPAWEKVAGYFVRAAGGRSAKTVILLPGGLGTIRHLPDYTGPLRQYGLTGAEGIFPEKSKDLDLERAQRYIGKADGILCGGGPTQVYQHMFAREPLLSLIRTRYESGVPYAGISAGALIVPAKNVYWEGEVEDKDLKVFSGLGLAEGFIVDVHFTEWHRLPRILEAMAKTGILHGWGIDEGACAVFQDRRFAGIIGRGVYRIELTSIRTGNHRIVETVREFKGKTQ